MVIEMLTFQLDDADRERWLRADEQVWTRFLAQQPGFVRKEVWNDEQPGLVHAVIWWQSMPEWKAITPAKVAELDAEMGDLYVEPTCRTFQVFTSSQQF